MWRQHETEPDSTFARNGNRHHLQGQPNPDPGPTAVLDHASKGCARHSLCKEYGVSLHAIDSRSLALGRIEALCPGREDCAFHAISFTPDGRHVAYTVIGRALSVEVLSLKDRAMTCLLERFPSSLAPKWMTFSADGRFALIPLSFIAVSVDSSNYGGGMLTVHRFHATGWCLPDNLLFPHGIDARADGRHVAITTFGDDTVHIAAAAPLKRH